MPRRSAAEQTLEPMLSQAEVLHILKISPRQLLRLIATENERGEAQVPLPYRMVGSRRKFVPSEVSAWVRAQRTEG